MLLFKFVRVLQVLLITCTAISFHHISLRISGCGERSGVARNVN